MYFLPFNDIQLSKKNAFIISGSPVFLLKCCTNVSHHGHVYTKRLSDLFNIFVISIVVIY